MGLEALSRGAAHAVLVDKSDKACGILRKNAEKTRLLQRTEIRAADALSYLNSYAGEPFHLIFLDPPYAAGLLAPALRAIASRKLATEGATIVAECGDPNDLFGGDDALAASYEILKTKRYGAAHVFFLTPAHKEELCPTL
jgi:16S rRNA (guanine(966)-N(2))-methyltransferase RsmD